MFFALGFLVAGFIAVLLTSALNQRAERLANRRMRAMFPVSLEEVAAERDHLRAEFAVATRTMERKQARLREEKAVALGDAGKQISFANALKRELDETRAKLATLEATHADLRTDLAEARKQIGTATSDRETVGAELAAASAEKDRLAREQKEAVKRVEGQRMAIAELEQRISAISAAASEQKRQAERRGDELLVEQNAVRTLQETLASHRANAARLADRIAALEKTRDEARAASGAVGKLEAEIRALRERLAQAQGENQVLRHKMAAENATQTATTPAAPKAAANQEGPDAVIADIARLQADLARAASGRQAHGGQIPGGQIPSNAAEALRKRIVDVAEAIMARPEADSPAATPSPPPPRRRGGRPAGQTDAAVRQGATRKSAP